MKLNAKLSANIKKNYFIGESEREKKEKIHFF